MAKPYGPQQKRTKPPTGERQRRVRFYARNIRRQYPQLGAQLAHVAMKKVEKTQRALWIAGAVKAIAWVGIFFMLAALQCVVNK